MGQNQASEGLCLPRRGTLSHWLGAVQGKHGLEQIGRGFQKAESETNKQLNS